MPPTLFNPAPTTVALALLLRPGTPLVRPVRRQLSNNSFVGSISTRSTQANESPRRNRRSFVQLLVGEAKYRAKKCVIVMRRCRQMRGWTLRKMEAQPLLLSSRGVEPKYRRTTREGRRLQTIDVERSSKQIDVDRSASVGRRAVNDGRWTRRRERTETSSHHLLSSREFDEDDDGGMTGADVESECRCPAPFRLSS